MKKKVLLLVLAVLLAFGAVGCSKARTVNRSLSKEANQFNVYRRLTVVNTRTDTVMLRAEGYMSLTNNLTNELVVTIKTGEDSYFKDYIYLNSWTCYVMEQIEPESTNPYYYDLKFYPEGKGSAIDD